MRYLAALLAALLVASSASALDGDGNCDGTVDGADYTLWADHWGAENPAGPAQGDFNSDGTVDGADYTLWADHYGETGEPCLDVELLEFEIEATIRHLRELLRLYAEATE